MTVARLICLVPDASAARVCAAWASVPGTRLHIDDGPAADVTGGPYAVLAVGAAVPAMYDLLERASEPPMRVFVAAAAPRPDVRLTVPVTVLCGAGDVAAAVAWHAAVDGPCQVLVAGAGPDFLAEASDDILLAILEDLGAWRPHLPPPGSPEGLGALR